MDHLLLCSRSSGPRLTPYCDGACRRWAFWRFRSTTSDSPPKGTGHTSSDMDLWPLERTFMECDIFFRSTRECPLDRIEDFQAFVAIVEKGSLTAAAKQLGRSLP